MLGVVVPPAVPAQGKRGAGGGGDVGGRTRDYKKASLDYIGKACPKQRGKQEEAGQFNF